MNKLTWEHNGSNYVDLSLAYDTDFEPGMIAVGGPAIDRLAAYEDTGLMPDEIKTNMEMFAAYRHVCGGKSPEEVAKLVTGNPVSEQPTNADRIRGMTDEELAEFLRNIRDCDDYDELKLIGGVRMDYVSVIEWLRQPAETEGTE